LITIENTEIVGWEASIRGCRNPMNSWAKSDSLFDVEADMYSTESIEPFGHTINGEHLQSDSLDDYTIGPNDHKLMMNLAKAGSVDAKYRRMIVVYADITAPLYWWKEFDTYKIATVSNSCSTMHKIHAKEFTLDDFSSEHLMSPEEYEISHDDGSYAVYGDFKGLTTGILWALNDARTLYLETKDKRFWWQMIQLLPSSYNQRRTIMMNYEVLAGIYPKRKDHKLDEWRDFCDWIKTLPYSELITLEESCVTT
jgi:hypothetical protein